MLVVDEHVDDRDQESYTSGAGETVRRTLRDGRPFRIVKNPIDPDRLMARLTGLGWDCVLPREQHGWILREARPARRSPGAPAPHDVTNVIAARWAISLPAARRSEQHGVVPIPYRGGPP